MTNLVPRGVKGQWLPGHSGNPGGRPHKPTREIAELARSHAPEAIAILLDIARDANEKGMSRVRACEALLNRGYGTPALESTLHSIMENSRPITFKFALGEVDLESEGGSELLDCDG